MKMGLLVFGMVSLGVLTLSQVITPALLVTVFSAVIHECGHVAALWLYGIKIHGVSVSVRNIGIQVEEQRVAKLTPAQKSVVLWMGVAANFALVFVASVALFYLEQATSVGDTVSVGLLGTYSVIYARIFFQGVLLINVWWIWMALVPITISDGRRVLAMAIKPQRSWYRKLLFRVLSILILMIGFFGLLKGAVLAVTVNGLYFLGFRRVAQTVDDARLHIEEAPLWLARLNLVLYVVVILLAMTALALILPYPERFFYFPS